MLIDMSKRLLHLGFFALLLLGFGAATAPALAHPHVWIVMKAELVYAPDGSVKAVRHAWTFDDMFSVFAIQGIESKKKNEFTREELRPLAQTNVESLKDFDYFTYAKLDGKKLEFNDPTNDYYLDYKESELTLHFTLPLKTPVKAKEIDFEVYDPSYFVEFSFAEKDAVKLSGAPAQCKLTLVTPQAMDAAMAQDLSQLGPDAQLDPSQWLGSQFANRMLVKCP